MWGWAWVGNMSAGRKPRRPEVGFEEGWFGCCYCYAFSSFFYSGLKHHMTAAAATLKMTTSIAVDMEVICYIHNKHTNKSIKTKAEKKDPPHQRKEYTLKPSQSNSPTNP
jgi:hypothetical protein